MEPLRAEITGGEVVSDDERLFALEVRVNILQRLIIRLVLNDEIVRLGQSPEQARRNLSQHLTLDERELAPVIGARTDDPSLTALYLETAREVLETLQKSVAKFR